MLASQSGENYEFISILGRGSYGTVSKVRRASDGKECALKVVTCDNFREVEAAMRESTGLHELPPHENLIRVIETFFSTIIPQTPAHDTEWNQRTAQLLGDQAYLERPAHVSIVMEYYPSGDLAGFLRRAAAPGSDGLSRGRLLGFTSQICSCLRHIHSQQPPVIHRDLKPENILISGAEEHPRLVVADFGIAKNLEKTYLSEQGGTLPYIAPETWDRRSGPWVDMWAMGCIAYLMATRHLSARVKVMFNEARRPGFPRCLADEAAVARHGGDMSQLLCGLLRVEFRERLTAAEAAEMLRDASSHTRVAVPSRAQSW